MRRHQTEAIRFFLMVARVGLCLARSSAAGFK